MSDILEQIVAHKRVELVAQQEQLPLRELVARVEQAPRREPLSMRASLAASSSGIIAEFKRKSPSKGWIFPEAIPTEVVPSYADAGAAALSILTDEDYFGGSMDYVEQVRGLVPGTPILRKDFIIDSYQLFQAKLIGADAVLLIASCLSPAACRQLASEAHQLGLETLLEVHTEAELDYVGEDIDMVGVNNRHLGTFHTDVAVSFALAGKLPKDFLLVSESGISQAETIRQLRAAGFRGFLIGEALMRTPHPGAALRQLIADIQA